MKERPILFSGEMIRAILDGRKTQTRRVVKPAPGEQSEWLTMENLHGFVQSGEMINGRWQMWHPKGGPRSPYGSVTCPYGKPGNLLYVRESFWIHMLSNGETIVRYAATEKSTPSRLRPAIHMPRSASRLTLEITEVRVERVQDISEEDAESEGANAHCEECGEIFDCEKSALGYCWRPDCVGSEEFSCRKGFQLLWDSIKSKKHPWESNPWVWVVCFKRVEV